MEPKSTIGRGSGAPGVVLIAPPWPYTGSANLFAAQVAAHAWAGRKVMLLLGPTDCGHCADQAAFWDRSEKGLTFPEASLVAHALNSDQMAGRNSKSYVQWRTARGDDVIAVTARYAACSDPPAEALTFINDHRIELVHVNHCFEAWLGQRVADLVERLQGHRPAVVLDTHDVQAAAVQAAGKTSHFTRRPDPLETLRKTELELCRSADVLIHCSPDDLAYFEAGSPGQRHELLLPSLDPRTERTLVADRSLRREADFDFLYVGNNNRPNFESVAWLLDQVVPRLGPKVRIAIVGRVEELVRSERPDLRARYTSMMIGEVDHIDDYYRRSRAVIAPAVSGTGTSIKLIEGLCAGKPMTVTSHALRGLRRIGEVENFFAPRDRPEDFAWAMGQQLKTGVSFCGSAAALYDGLFSNARYFEQLNAIIGRRADPSGSIEGRHQA